jgi:hypothetical protein
MVRDLRQVVAREFAKLAAGEGGTEEEVDDA